MSNVIQFGGAMRPSKSIRLRKLTEADLDRAIERNRERHDEAMQALAPASLPQPIQLGGSWLARAMRWVRR